MYESEAASRQPGPFQVAYFNTLDLSGEVVSREDHAGGELLWLGDVAPALPPNVWYAYPDSLVPATAEYHVGMVTAGLRGS